MSVYCLVDCNNFYVSCERLFNPALENRPVVVLTGVDGCVVARSNEAKALGIAMGEPLFKCKQLVHDHGVAVQLANLRLYGHISQRIMSLLAAQGAELEVYSIDEAFLCFDPQLCADSLQKHLESMQQLRQEILHGLGIPVSIGIAPSKTLAKLAAGMAKRSRHGVFSYFQDEQSRRQLFAQPIEEVWGIGAKHAQWLKRWRMHSVADFMRCETEWLLKNRGINLLRSYHELHGRDCYKLQQQAPPAKSIVCSRSFVGVVSELEYLLESISQHAERAAAKLRKKQRVCNSLGVFLHTNRFDKNHEQQRSVQYVDLGHFGNYTPNFVAAARQAMRILYRKGFSYKSCGVMLFNLREAHNWQADLFSVQRDSPVQQQLMRAMDAVNARYGSHTLVSAGSLVRTESAAAGGSNWQQLAKSLHIRRSGDHMSDWSRLATVHAR